MKLLEELISEVNLLINEKRDYYHGESDQSSYSDYDEGVVNAYVTIINLLKDKNRNSGRVGTVPLTLDKISYRLGNIDEELNDIRKEIYEIKLSNLRRDYTGVPYATGEKK